MSIEQIHQKPLYTHALMNLAMDDDDDDKRAMFSGVAITTGYNKRNYRFSLPSLQSLAKWAKKGEMQNGVPLYVMHSTWDDLPIGRTLSGMIRKKTDLEISAYINRNVPSPDTNSIIERMEDDTIDSLSISWDLTPKSYFQCDVCSEKMDKGYFMPHDSKYHYPGKKLEDGTIVTATVQGPIEFRELSIVGIGADPRAKMLQDTEVQDALRKEFSTLSIQPHDIPTISELSGWDEGMFSQSLSLFSIPNKGVSAMATEETLEESTDEPSVAGKNWRTLYEESQAEIATLKASKEGLITLGDHQSQVTHLREQLDEEKQLRETSETTAKENEFYAKLGLVSLELARDRATRAFKTFKGNKVEDPISQATLKKLQENTDLKWLSGEADEYWSLADAHKNTRAHEEEQSPRTQKKFLEGVEANL